MPRFLYSVTLLDLLSLLFLFKIITTEKPEDTSVIAVVLFLIWAIVFLTSSIGIFFINRCKAPVLSNSKLVYRKGLRYALGLATLITSLCGLKVSGLFNAMNVSLVVLLCLSVLVKSRNR